MRAHVCVCVCEGYCSRVEVFPVCQYIECNSLPLAMHSSSIAMNIIPFDGLSGCKIGSYLARLKHSW